MTRRGEALADMDFGAYDELVARKTIRGIAELRELGGSSIAFYAGSFNPPHLGHLAVMETALISAADHVVVSVHSHNPTKSDELVSLPDRIVMTALTIDAPGLGERIHLASPDLLDGIQNREFLDLAGQLKDHGIEPWLVLGADALKPTHPDFLRDLPHLVASRAGVASPPSQTILRGEVREIETLHAPLHRARERDPSLIGVIYDAGLNALHRVMERASARWPVSGDCAFLSLSGRVEGGEWQDIRSESAAFWRPGEERWDLTREPLRFRFDQERVCWVVEPG